MRPTTEPPSKIFRPPPFQESELWTEKDWSVLIWRTLAGAWLEQRPWQIRDVQGLPSGLCLNPEWGLPDPSHLSTVPFLAAAALLGWHPHSPLDETTREEARSRFLAGWQGLDSALPGSGRLDLASCNYDSAPDTAFALQMLLAVLEWMLLPKIAPAVPRSTIDHVMGLCRRMAEGVKSGGFHTPNHRWVISSSLAQARQLLPTFDPEPALTHYLAEGLDANPDGAFLERSSGIYDAVTDRSLLFIHRCLGWPEALPGAIRNLRLNLHLLRPEGTIDTCFSRRQDQGQPCHPGGLAACYLMAAHEAPETSAEFLAAAGHLLAHLPASQLSGWAWAALAAELTPVRKPPPPWQPPQGWHHFPSLQWSQCRRGRREFSVFGDSPRLLLFRQGQAEVRAVRISLSYFGAGQFAGEEMHSREGLVELRSRGRAISRRPGYELPLGHRVAPAEWEDALPRRELLPMPPAESRLTIRETEDGLRLLWQTHSALPHGVTGWLAFDFAPGGVWETPDNAFQPTAGMEIFLTAGWGRMRYGTEAIQVGPGAQAHRMWQMRDAGSAGASVRVLVAVATSVDREFFLQGLPLAYPTTPFPS